MAVNKCVLNLSMKQNSPVHMNFLNSPHLISTNSSSSPQLLLPCPCEFPSPSPPNSSSPSPMNSPPTSPPVLHHHFISPNTKGERSQLTATSQSFSSVTTHLTFLWNLSTLHIHFFQKWDSEKERKRGEKDPCAVRWQVKCETQRKSVITLLAGGNFSENVTIIIALRSLKTPKTFMPPCFFSKQLIVLKMSLCLHFHLSERCLSLKNNWNVTFSDYFPDPLYGENYWFLPRFCCFQQKEC